MPLRIDTQAIGLETYVAFSRWLTGQEHLHYGLWTGLAVEAANVGLAQEAYMTRLLSLCPGRADLRILDIGGGAGQTARRLIGLGHRVEIVVPSGYLAARCRVNAPQAIVHECRFEDLASPGAFDLCLFSESFQYIPLPVGLAKARSLLAPGGEIVIGDCFRVQGHGNDPNRALVGGGHPIAAFRAVLAALPLRVVAELDVTEAVAPSVDVEQALFNVIGVGVTGIDRELASKRRLQHWLIRRAIALAMTRRKRDRLAARLFLTERNSAAFLANNCYLLLRIAQT